VKKRVDLARIWFLTSCAVVLFAYGVAVGRYEIFPFEILNYGVESIQTLRREATTLTGLRPAWHLKPARYEGNGVTVADVDAIAPGLTFVTGLFDGAGELRLLEADGSVVTRWPAPFTEIFEDPDHFGSGGPPQTDWNAQVHGALALPDGSVVFNFDYGGAVRMDRCGEVQWVLPYQAHHSVERSERGGFWIPVRIHARRVAGFPETGEDYGEDWIFRVSDDGEVVDRVAVGELFQRNGLLHLLLMKGWDRVFHPGEIVHLNDVEELPDSLAGAFPGFAAGDLVLSFRNLHMLMVVEPDGWTVKWRQMGPWIRQHDPDFEPDGTITVFDNRDDDTVEGSHLGGSRILAVAPRDGAVETLYGGRAGETVYTDIMGKQQKLPNGNVLITESQAGRLLEVTPAGDVVWELINRYDEDEVAVMAQATRYAPDYFEVEDWTCPTTSGRGSGPLP